MRPELKAPDSPRYIYTIRDPDGCVRYVGMTWNIEQRISCHLCSDSPIARYIKECNRKGKKLKLVIECEVPYAKAAETEREYIAKYALASGRKLLNHQGNGRRRNQLRWQAYMLQKSLTT